MANIWEEMEADIAASDLWEEILYLGAYGGGRLIRAGIGPRDMEGDVGRTRIAHDVLTIEVLKADVHEPVADDEFRRRGVLYRVSGEPRPGALNTTWLLDAYAATDQ